MIFRLLKHFFKIEKNLIAAALLFSLLYGFLYSFFWISPLSLKEFALLTWVNILFALLLVSPELYANDLHDGFLDFLFSQKVKVWQLFCGKISFIFLGYFLPILGASFLNGLFFNQSVDVIFQVILGPLILSPAIILLLHTGSLLTLNSHSKSFLIPILMIPFFIPLIILGLSINIKFHDLEVFPSLLLGGIGMDIFYCILGFIFSKFLIEDHYK